MDLLFKRYADPFSLLDGFIQTSRFVDFIEVLCGQVREDRQWEFFLHKVWDKNWEEITETVQTTQDLQDMSDVDIETTVRKSMNILGNFIPEREEGEM